MVGDVVVWGAWSWSRFEAGNHNATSCQKTPPIGSAVTLSLGDHTRTGRQRGFTSSSQTGNGIFAVLLVDGDSCRPHPTVSLAFKITKHEYLFRNEPNIKE